MKQEKQRAPGTRSLLLLLLLLQGHVHVSHSNDDEKKKFGDKCSFNEECGFEGSFCDNILGKCLCKPEVPITNHLDKCGVAAKVNESCFFREQCEYFNYLTECRDGFCVCRFQRVPVPRSDGTIECIAIIPTNTTPGRYVDPAMIGILVAMFLMFITICIVLRLFSKARWSENRTIFNTPNPRLMNVSLLRDTKLLHQERRGSKSSHGPSRPASVSSLPPHSPNSQGSRRESRGSSVSAASVKTNKSPSKASNLSSAAAPMLEHVTVEVQDSKH